MDFAAILLFTQQVFHLQGFSFQYMRLLFGIKSHPGVTYESVAYKKECNVVLWPCKHEETTFPHEFFLVFTQNIIGTVFSTKLLPKVGELEIL